MTAKKLNKRNSKYTEMQWREARKMYALGKNDKEISKETGIPLSSICLNRKKYNSLWESTENAEKISNVQKQAVESINQILTTAELTIQELSENDQRQLKKIEEESKANLYIRQVQTGGISLSSKIINLLHHAQSELLKIAQKKGYLDDSVLDKTLKIAKIQEKIGLSIDSISNSLGHNRPINANQTNINFPGKDNKDNESQSNLEVYDKPKVRIPSNGREIIEVNFIEEVKNG
jgi:hypothetical protein